jgi:hypothetical protein
MATCDKPGDSCTSGPRRQRPASWKRGQKAAAPRRLSSSAASAVTIMIWITENSYPNSRRIRGPHPIAADVAAYEKHVQPSCQQAGITRGGR